MQVEVYPAFVMLIFLAGLITGTIIEGRMKDRKHHDEVLRLTATIKRLREELNLLVTRRRKR